LYHGIAKKSITKAAFRIAILARAAGGESAGSARSQYPLFVWREHPTRWQYENSHDHQLIRWLAPPYKGMLLAGLKAHRNI